MGRCMWCIQIVCSFDRISEGIGQRSAAKLLRTLKIRRAECLNVCISNKEAFRGFRGGSSDVRQFINDKELADAPFGEHNGKRGAGLCVHGCWSSGLIDKNVNAYLTTKEPVEPQRLIGAFHMKFAKSRAAFFTLAFYSF